MKSIEFHELAIKELLDSRDFYDNLIWGLGRKFIIEVGHIISRIKNNPAAFPIYFKNYKRALIRKFPYSVIYIEEDERILILAVAHHKRRPQYFANRINWKL